VNLQDLESKGLSLQDLQNIGVKSIWSFLETQARGWWILSLRSFNYTRGVKADCGRSFLRILDFAMPAGVPSVDLGAVVAAD
jgi:hypothetical protein